MILLGAWEGVVYHCCACVLIMISTDGSILSTETCCNPWGGSNIGRLSIRVAEIAMVLCEQEGLGFLE